jgi:hypothetical protein
MKIIETSKFHNCLNTGLDKLEDIWSKLNRRSVLTVVYDTDNLFDQLPDPSHKTELSHCI